MKCTKYVLYEGQLQDRVIQKLNIWNIHMEGNWPICNKHHKNYIHKIRFKVIGKGNTAAKGSPIAMSWWFIPVHRCHFVPIYSTSTNIPVCMCHIIPVCLPYHDGQESGPWRLACHTFYSSLFHFQRRTIPGTCIKDLLKHSTRRLIIHWRLYNSTVVLLR